MGTYNSKRAPVMVVEGSIARSSLAKRPGKRRSPRWKFFPLECILLCVGGMLFGQVLLLLFAAPGATIVIHPVLEAKSGLVQLTATVTPTTAAQSQARQLTASQLAPARSVQTTGIVQKPATVAHGMLTFYNPAAVAQTVAAGTTFTVGQQGLQIVTDQAVTIPPGTPSVAGSAPVAAHAQQTGRRGDIGPLTINGLCAQCGTDIAVKNLGPFSGGQDVENYTAVSQADVDTVARSQELALEAQAHTALRGQMRGGEQLGTPIACAQQVTSRPPVGARATWASVQVAVSCTTLVFDPHDVQQRAAGLFAAAVERSLDRHQVLARLTARIQALVASRPGSTLFLWVLVEGRWIYRFSAAEQSRLMRHLAGKPREQALTELLNAPGIQEAEIEGIQGNDLLPSDPAQLTLQIVSPP